MHKAVVDTNVWISALHNPGNPRQITRFLQSGKFRLVCTEQILLELFRVLKRPKFAATIDKKVADELISLIENTALFVEFEQIPVISRDPKDDIYLACAAVTECDFIVTGDKDLLSLHKYASAKIVSPVEFLKVLNK